MLECITKGDMECPLMWIFKKRVDNRTFRFQPTLEFQHPMRMNFNCLTSTNRTKQSKNKHSLPNIYTLSCEMASKLHSGRDTACPCLSLLLLVSTHRHFQGHRVSCSSPLSHHLPRPGTWVQACTSPWEVC